MLKVVIAEDDQISRKILVNCVKKLGYLPIEASNGTRAWGIIDDNQDIALLITDMMMPDMSGEDLIKILRGNESTRNLPIIIVSGVVSVKEIGHLLELGASRFVPKPVKASVLESEIQAILR